MYMTREQRRDLAEVVLDGLSVGDAFGELFSYGSESVRERVGKGVPAGPWWWTDGAIEEPTLAWVFARNYKRQPDRGYGRMARRVLDGIAAGEDWQHVSSTAFDGGSMGNGAAMRVGPLGAWFADDLDRVAKEAWRSARVTHWHPEGIAGAVALALAVALAWQTRDLPAAEARPIISLEVVKRIPEGATRSMVESACRFDPSSSPAEAGRALGNGALVTAPDTVPYVIWSALRSFDNYAEALLATVEGGGDCDTNAAMVGSIVAARLGRSSIPAEWLAAREPLPTLA
jgi:ADP-ribosylglycohydrolase